MINAEHLDGSATAGELAELFGGDVTLSSGPCRSCDRQVTIAEARTYLGGPGTVLRCPGCDAVLLRIVRSPRRTLLDTSGFGYLELIRTPSIDQ